LSSRIRRSSWIRSGRDNATRGVVEYVVALAFGVDVSDIRERWATFDLLTPSGIKVDVKSAAYLQSWRISLGHHL
jgi:hypothetical protein